MPSCHIGIYHPGYSLFRRLFLPGLIFSQIHQSVELACTSDPYNGGKHPFNYGLDPIAPFNYVLNDQKKFT